MIKAEIKTDAMTYDININGYDDVQAAYDYVVATLESTRVFKGDTTILQLGDAAFIKHIKVYKTDLPAVGHEVTDGVALAKEMLTAIEDRNPMRKVTLNKGQYLGNPISMKCQTYEAEGHVYYLPMEINDLPAYEVLGESSQREYINTWASSMGFVVAAYTVVVPPAQLPDYDEAIEYLRDYVRETQEAKERPAVYGNAKAWQEWHDKRL